VRKRGGLTANQLFMMLEVIASEGSPASALPVHEGVDCDLCERRNYVNPSLGPRNTVSA
jgi:hypothetical protein